MTKQLNVYNATGVRGDWTIGVEGGEVLVNSIKNWTEARDAAVAIARQQGYDTVLLMKMNGAVQNVPLGRKAASAQELPVVEGDVVFIARVSMSIDHDPAKELVVDTLDAAIKALPRKAHGLAWNATPFDSHTLDDGRIVSTERTTN